MAGDRMWRTTFGAHGWRRVEVPIPPLARAVALTPWGDEVLLTYQQTGRWSGARLGPAGQVRPVAPLPNTVTQLGFTAIGTAGAMNMWFVGEAGHAYLWRRPDEPPIALPADLIALSAHVAAIDDDHLLGISLSGALVEVTLNGTRPPGPPCGGLFRYLSEAPTANPQGSELALVSSECRQAARRGEAPALLGLVRSWAERADRADLGRALACSLQDERVIADLPRWFHDGTDEHAKSVCYRSLANWPGTESVWSWVLDHAIYERPDGWQVEPAVVDLASASATAAVRDRFLPVVRVAAGHRAVGFDALRAVVCAADEASTEVQRKTCAELASQREADWRQQEVDLEARRQHTAAMKRHVPLIIGATIVTGGAVAATYATRANEVGRGIAVASGAFSGAAIGFAAVSLSALRGSWVSKSGRELPGLTIGAMVVGAVLGGAGTYLLTGAPGARAPATAVALAFPYALTLSLTFD